MSSRQRAHTHTGKTTEPPHSHHNPKPWQDSILPVKGTHTSLVCVVVRCNKTQFVVFFWQPCRGSHLCVCVSMKVSVRESERVSVHPIETVWSSTPVRPCGSLHSCGTHTYVWRVLELAILSHAALQCASFNVLSDVLRQVCCEVSLEVEKRKWKRGRKR